MASKSQIEAIINRIAPYMQKYAKEYGYHICSPAIAQALQESLGKYDGLSLLAYKYHNLFGLKCGSAWLKAGKPSVSLKTGEEYTVGKITQITDYFRVFESEEAGCKGYYEFLQASRYSNLKACTSYVDYMYKIKADGYCTSSTYVSNCISKIKAYNLDRFDNFDYVPATSSTVSTEDVYKVGKVYTLQSDLYVRASASGSKLKYDNLTKDGKANAKYDDYGCAILKSGTRVSCKAIKELESSIWMQIPSGWICAKSKDKVYVK